MIQLARAPRPPPSHLSAPSLLLLAPWLLTLPLAICSPPPPPHLHSPTPVLIFPTRSSCSISSPSPFPSSFHSAPSLLLLAPLAPDPPLPCTQSPPANTPSFPHPSPPHPSPLQHETSPPPVEGKGAGGKRVFGEGGEGTRRRERGNRKGG